MGVLISLLSLLLVAAAGGLRAAVAVSMDEAYYNSASEVKAYWKTALPNSPMPSAILQHLSPHADGEKVTLQQSAYTKEGDEKATFQWGSYVKEDNDKITSQRDVRMKEGDGKITFQWGPHNKGAQATFRQDPYMIEGGEKVTFQWGPQKDLADEKVTFHWGPDMKEDDDKTSLQLGQHKVSDEKVTFRWGPQEEGNDGKVTVGWGPQRELGDEKATFGWGPNMKEDDEEVTLRLGQHKVDDEKVTFRWGPNMKQDDGKVTLRCGQHKDGNKKFFFWWGPQEEGNDEEVTLWWGSSIKKDDEKVTFGWAPRYDEKVTSQWGSHTKIEDDKVTFLWSSHKRREDERDAEKFPSPHQEPYVKEEHHQWHGTGHNYGQINLANLLFSEAVLTPGTMVTPYIESSVLPTPFLRRDVADSIPVSTKNFTDILALFMPMSFAMAGRIWSTLNTCEHPHPLEGEQQACATSIESMVELATSVLGTRDVRAFSSSLDVPAEGVASPLTRHTVAAVRAVTAPGEAATTMTCHGATFPYAVFYCHAVNPTRVYDVTLRRAEEDGAAAAAPATTMQVLAVCHLDTSQFDPENPFFVERGLKPGDASVCHFLSRDSVLWAPAASTKGYEQVTAQ